MGILEDDVLSVWRCLVDRNITLCRSLEGLAGSGFALNDSHLTGVGFLGDGVGLDDLFDKLLESSTVFFSLEHFSVDGNFGIEGLLGIEEHLQFDHEGLAFFAHLADLGISVVEGSFVGSLVVFQLVVELLDLFFKKGVAAFKVSEFSTQIGKLGTESLDLFLGVSLFHALSGRLGLDLLDLETVPGFHVVSVDVVDLVVFLTDVTNSRSQFVLEELAVLWSGITGSQCLEVLNLVVMNTTREINLLKKSLNLVLVVNTVEGLLVQISTGSLKLRKHALILLLDAFDFILELSDATFEKIDLSFNVGELDKKPVDLSTVLFTTLGGLLVSKMVRPPSGALAEGVVEEKDIAGNTKKL
ncbi:hypothetical protein GCK72_023751 [Caenorhabditis remanei]|uniref:Uncharacterized protein n=1 Tax=Caenorhabditis remanei TaxID=31234 RepID=A0A6A5FY44_CAERE|nr:hypothetical protein GCK72_023751 [Caenorhabditis remanei]KAF1747289.1 hypothetical protein GCK72_023751 [Caenorhabditis remanei]